MQFTLATLAIVLSFLASSLALNSCRPESSLPPGVRWGQGQDLTTSYSEGNSPQQFYTGSKNTLNFYGQDYTLMVIQSGFSQDMQIEASTIAGSKRDFKINFQDANRRNLQTLIVSFRTRCASKAIFHNRSDVQFINVQPRLYA